MAPLPCPALCGRWASLSEQVPPACLHEVERELVQAFIELEVGGPGRRKGLCGHRNAAPAATPIVAAATLRLQHGLEHVRRPLPVERLRVQLRRAGGSRRAG